MTKIAVIGSIVTDLAVHTSRLPAAGENIRADSLAIGPGGKGANAAVAAARAGAEVVLIGCIGADYFGEMEMDHLRREGIDTASVAVLADAATGAAIILIEPDGENTILVVNGANERLSAQAVWQALEAQGQALDGILINFEIPEAAVAAGVQYGRSRGIAVVVDAGPPRTYAPATWAGCTILTPNALETATLAGFPVQDPTNAARAARQLLAAGPQAVVLKQGAEGALLVTTGREIHIPGFPVEVVDTTGAGDAFSATLALAVADGMRLELAVRRANAAGALTATRRGTLPAMPTRLEIDEFLTQRRPA